MCVKIPPLLALSCMLFELSFPFRMAIISCMPLSFLCCLYVMMAICEGSFFPEFENRKSCTNDGNNYTANITYHTNLDTLLFNLSSNTQIDYGFYTFSYGLDTDKVYAIGLCRGDLKPDECRSCLNYSIVSLTQFCPNQKEAIAWDAQCMLRYSNRSIFGAMEASPPYYMHNVNNATDVDEFNRKLSELLRNLRDKAASGDCRRKYATDTAIVANFATIYGLVQCTPDLSSQDCSGCVYWSTLDIPRFFKDKVGGIVLDPVVISDMKFTPSTTLRKY